MLLLVFVMPPLVGLVSSGLSACLFHKDDPCILSQITPSYSLSQSASFCVTIPPYYCFSALFYLFAPSFFPLSLPFFPRARVSITCTSALLCAYYHNCGLQYKANTFVYSSGFILTTTDDGNFILSSTPIIWTGPSVLSATEPNLHNLVIWEMKKIPTRI